MVEDRFEYINKQYLIIEELKKELQEKEKTNLSHSQKQVIEEERCILDRWCEELRDKMEKYIQDNEQEEKRIQKEKEAEFQREVEIYNKGLENINQTLKKELNKLKEETEQKLMELEEEEKTYIKELEQEKETKTKEKEKKKKKKKNSKKKKKIIAGIVTFLLIATTAVSAFLMKKNSTKNSDIGNKSEQTVDLETEEQNTNPLTEQEQTDEPKEQETPREETLETNSKDAPQVIVVEENSYVYTNSKDAINEQNGRNPYYEVGNNGVERVSLGYVLQNDSKEIQIIYITDNDYQLKISTLQENGYIIVSVLTATYDNYQEENIETEKDINDIADGWYNYQKVKRK